MSTRQLNENEMSVIRALVRDVGLATIALKDEVAFTDWLVGVAGEARRRTWSGDSLQAFEDYVVGDVQQRFHDEFIDVTWPRCPRHPNHPLWLQDGAWWCTKDNVRIPSLGELASSQAAGR